MRLFIFLLSLAPAIYAIDEQRLALMAQAESAFDRVQLSAAPRFSDTAGCVQAQAALLPIASPEDRPLVHFRKGYCMLVGATIARQGSEFAAAAREFEAAIGAWHERPTGKKNGGMEPVSPALRVLAAIAKLEGGASDPAARAATEIGPVLEDASGCASTLMAGSLCDDILRAGREWLGWLALRAGNLKEAARYFVRSSGSGWPEWVAARQAFEAGRYGEAAAGYRRAVQLLHPTTPLAFPTRLGPPADEAGELIELGAAELLAGDAAGAVATLDSAVKLNPTGSRALYLRARAKELAGETSGALADYNLASRTAFANSKELASGEAHLYRGILFYRRRDFGHAEDEFASALNFTIAPEMRADAVAWRHMAAVAGGACEASRRYLERSLASASPFFPSGEASAAIRSCRGGETAGGAVK